MARKTSSVVINAEGRDKGKVFILTEMSAAAIDWWGTRALLALAKSGATIPAEIEDSGFEGVVALGIKAFGGLDPETMKTLLDELMGCVQIVPNPSNPIPRALHGQDDIEEWKTIKRLQAEVFALHAGFSLADAALILREKAAAVRKDSQPTKISPESLAQ